MLNEKNILCFGDSNTWGCNPAGGSRFDRFTRWTGVLQQELGEGFHIIEEGLCGRTTVWDDPIEQDKNGSRVIVPLLKTHMPLDLLVIMLGTNDLKNRFNVSALDVANSIGTLVEMTRNTAVAFVGGRPEILVVCPPPLADLEATPFKNMFVQGAEKSHQLVGEVQARCALDGVRMLDAGTVVQSSPLDGIHFDEQEHGKLGRAVASVVREML